MTLKPDYTIGDVHFSFGSWMQKTYCEKMGMELDDLHTSMANGTAFKVKHLPLLLKTGAEAYSLFNKENKQYTELDAFQWIDSIGGFNSQEVVELFKTFASSVLSIDKSKLDVLTQEAEGKNGVRQEVVNA